MSSSFRVGFAIENKYASWQLTNGWAESIALELAIYWLIQEHYHDMNIMIHSDNTGVIGAFSSSCSCNPACNNCVCHITSSLIPANIMILPTYIASGDNLEGHVSHGIVDNYLS